MLWDLAHGQVTPIDDIMVHSPRTLHLKGSDIKEHFHGQAYFFGLQQEDDLLLR